MFKLELWQEASTQRFDSTRGFAEVISSAGLIIMIFALSRTGRRHLAAPVVAAYIGSAIWCTSSTAFANPAVTIGRMFTDTFTGIAPVSVPGFILAQVIGAGIGVCLVEVLFPKPANHPDATQNQGT
jgi:glycerol uptake facilitator-like aquaporin